MIEREITPHLLRSFEQYPFVTVTGPRDAGKTTLCRAVFAHLGYADLEDPRVRHHAESDPWGFLAGFPEGAVLDEVHHVPELLSCLKVHADEVRRNSLFVLTGSEQFGLIDNVTESLAGRTAMLRLLPFTLAERRRAGAGGRIDDIVYSGCYPRIHDQDLDPAEALGDYFASYVERDARRIGSIRNLDAFGRFARLCARRIGRQVNLRWLAAGAGVSPETARRWLDVLWVSDIVFTLSPTLAFPPFPATSRWSWIRRRRARSRRLYFCDVGLASYLLGIEDPGQVAAHPLREALFENLVVAETRKHAFNRGKHDFPSEVSYYRGAAGVECRLLYGRGQRIGAIETDPGATVSPDWFDPLTRIYEPEPRITSRTVVYGGSQGQRHDGGEAVPLSGLAELLRRLDREHLEPWPPPATTPLESCLSEEGRLMVAELARSPELREAVRELHREDARRVLGLEQE